MKSLGSSRHHLPLGTPYHCGRLNRTQRAPRLSIRISRFLILQGSFNAPLPDAARLLTDPSLRRELVFDVLHERTRLLMALRTTLALPRRLAGVFEPSVRRRAIASSSPLSLSFSDA